MAPLTLVSTKPFSFPKSYFPLPPNPNPNPNSLSLRSSPQTLTLKPLSLSPIHCTSNPTSNFSDFDQSTAVYPKPDEIEWSKELANSVRLIGSVGQPVQIRRLDSGKVVAWTKLGVWKSNTETTWINLNFWEDLAHVAYQHVQPGQRIFVAGKLVSDVVKGEDETVQVYYKVTVQQLNFVGKKFAPISSFEPRLNQTGSGNSRGSVEEMWQAFFASPLEWWDNRNNKLRASEASCRSTKLRKRNKTAQENRPFVALQNCARETKLRKRTGPFVYRKNLRACLLAQFCKVAGSLGGRKKNPNAPDFKHKDTGEALWLNGKYNPTWVKPQLEILDAKIASMKENDNYNNNGHNSAVTFSDLTSF